jgi:hypothetical protein
LSLSQTLSKKMRTFVRASSTLKILFLQTFFLLGIGRMSVFLLPFRKIAARIGEVGKEATANLTPDLTLELIQIGIAIEAVSKYTPWKSNCFAQALCAHWILKNRDIGHTIYFGVHKTGDDKLKAHAWLKVGSKIVTGRKGHKAFTAVGIFGS